MRKVFFALIVMLLGASAMATPTFDLATNVLTLDSVVVGGVTYNNVTVRVDSFSVLTVGSSSQPVTTPVTTPVTGPVTVATPVTSAAAAGAPVANAGAAQHVSPGSHIAPGRVTLNGSASSDPNGAALTYLWTLTSRPAGSDTVIASPATAATDIWVDTPGIYVASLVVSNGTLSSVPSTVVITAVDIPPAVSNPGPDQNVGVFSTVNLDGSQSYDPAGTAIASYQWTMISSPGSTSVITNAHGAIAQFIPDVIGDYVFELQVGGWRGGGILYSYERTTVHVHN